jgi:dihydrofolate reductase
MRVSVIVALAENRTIGRDGDLPWRLSADLKRFKRLTMGHHLLMGRRTFESIGRPLPGRTTIVVSRTNPAVPEGVHVVDSIEAGLDLARAAGEDELFVAGGAEVFGATLPLAHRLYLTRVEAVVDGDTFFPELEPSEWRTLSSEQREADARNDHPTTFEIRERSTSA